MDRSDLDEDNPLWRKIRKCSVFIIRHQFSESLVDYLYQEEVLTMEERCKVRAMPTPQDRNRELIEILSRKSIDGHKKYLIGLRECDQPIIADAIQKATIGAEAKSYGSSTQAKIGFHNKQQLSKRLRHLFCLGERNFKSDTYPYLVYCRRPPRRPPPPSAQHWPCSRIVVGDRWRSR